jgi:hypothetical protein
MLTIVFLAAILTVFLLFGLWLRLQALEQKIEEVADLLLPLLRDEYVMAESAEPTRRKPVIQSNGAVTFEHESEPRVHEREAAGREAAISEPLGTPLTAL